MIDTPNPLEAYALGRIADGHTVTLFFGSHSLLATTLAADPESPGMLKGEGVDGTEFLVSAVGLLAVRANKKDEKDSTVGFRAG